MVLHLAFGGFDQGFAPETPMASRAFARLGCADPILSDIKSQKLKPGLIAFEGMTKATFGFIQAEAHLGEPGA